MSNADIRGRFIWHELLTTDPEAAGAFYSKVVPWKTQPSGMPSYTLWYAGKAQTGGLMALPDDEAHRAGNPPHWLLYIGTPNVDTTVEEAQRLGGKVLKSASDIPNIGRFAVLTDPQGAVFAVYTPASARQPDGGMPAGAPGDFSWHELATTDHEAALRFYSQLFGWEKGPGHDMGSMGVYQLVEHGGKQVGGLYNLPGGATSPHWLSYVRVADVGKAAAAAKSAGGRVVNGPMEVPGGSWIAQIIDPQGGAFAVHEMPRETAAAKPSAAKSSAPKKAAAAKPKPAAAPAKPAASSDSKPKPAAAAAPPAPAKKSARKAAPTAGKKAVGKAAKTSAAARRKSAGKKKATAAKRSAAKKSTSAKRGSSAGKRPAAARKAAGKKAGVRAKGKKKR